jgi:type IV secretory pathway VirB10-like protein
MSTDRPSKRNKSTPDWWNKAIMPGADPATLNAVNDHYRVKPAPPPPTAEEEAEAAEQKQRNKAANDAIKKSIEIMETSDSIEAVEAAMESLEDAAATKTSRGKPGQASAQQRAAYHEARHRCTLSTAVGIWIQEEGFVDRLEGYERRYPALEEVWSIARAMLSTGDESDAGASDE